jgi:hypothetical protein
MSSTSGVFSRCGLNRDPPPQRISDKQTQSTLFRACAWPTIPHLLTANVYYSTTTDETAATYKAWSSPFLSTITNRSINFIRGLTDGHHPAVLPINYSKTIAFHPASMGALMAIAIIVLQPSPTLSSPLPAPSNTPNAVSLSTVIQFTPPLATANPLPHHGPNLAPNVPSSISSATTPLKDNRPSLAKSLPTINFKGLSSQLYRTHKCLQTTQAPNFAPVDVTIALPSLLSPLTSLPLHSPLAATQITALTIPSFESSSTVNSSYTHDPCTPP